MLPLFVVRKVLDVDIVKKLCPWSWHSINLENYCFISYQIHFVDCFLSFLKTQENFSTFLFLISYWTDMIICVSNLIQSGGILSKRTVISTKCVECNLEIFTVAILYACTVKIHFAVAWRWYIFQALQSFTYNHQVDTTCLIYPFSQLI